MRTLAAKLNWGSGPRYNDGNAVPRLLEHENKTPAPECEQA